MCIHGYRNEVDQAMFKLVRSKYITRLTWGVFTKAGAKRPSALEIAQIKARAFGKELVTHGAKLVDQFSQIFTAMNDSKTDNQLGQPPIPRTEDRNKDHLFFVQGRSSSFRYGDIRIYLHGTTSKRTTGGETTTSQVKRALWHLGNNATAPHLYLALHSLSIDMLEDLTEQAAWMPAWLSNAARSVLMPTRASPAGAT
jgi:hypothetical protein